MSRRLCVMLVLGLVCSGTVRAQVVTGEVAAVGFRASTTTGTQFVVREGQWVPIQLRLSVQGTTPFQGQLRFEAPDLDGDRVAYRATPVTVTYAPEPKRAWCYGVWLSDRSGRGGFASVDVLDGQGLLVNRLPLPAFDLISNDTMLILDISSQPLTRLRTLETPGWAPQDEGYGSRPYYRNVLISTMPARDLPDRWFGLEAVDVIVWDEPNLADAKVAEKLPALKEWVRNGGRLVVGLGRSWTAVQKSDLAEILPLQSPSAESAGPDQERGTTRTVDRLQQFFEQLTVPSQQRPASERTFRAPIPLATAEAKPGALRAFRTLVPGGSAIDLIAVQWVGSGRVVAVAASLRDLMQVPVNDAFYAQLFDLNPTTKGFLEEEAKSLALQLRAESKLYGDVLEPISFAGWSGLLVLAAFAFVVAYIGVATLASWAWLKKHSLTTLSWTVFAVIAVAASLLSLGTVGALHGVSRGVKTLTLVDLEAGASEARAKCYFGYSSPIRQNVDLSLPAPGSFLRSLAIGPDGASEYATPQRYAALPRAALLESTPMRATLKRFEGFWRGQLDGSIRARLVADRRTGEIVPTSWIQSDLDVRLAGGYLLYIDPRFQQDNVRIAGCTTTWWGRREVPPALNVLALWVPPLEPGHKVSGLGAEDYEELRRSQARWARLGQKPETRPDLYTLWDEQQTWVSGQRTRAPSRGLNATAHAVLLASTRDFYLHCAQDKDGFGKVNGRPITTDGLMALDVSHWLMQGYVKAPAGQTGDLLMGQALLLLLADGPGPPQLHRNGKPLSSAGGRTLYRVRVPLGYQGQPPRASEVFGP